MFTTSGTNEDEFKCKLGKTKSNFKAFARKEQELRTFGILTEWRVTWLHCESIDGVILKVFLSERYQSFFYGILEWYPELYSWEFQSREE